MGENKKDTKKFALLFTIISITILCCIMAVNYIVDPFFQYRVKDNAYILNPQFSDAGLIKNYDYNTIILGSSMIQNYNLSILRENVNLKPLKLSLGGLNLKETKIIDSLIDKSKLKTYIINIDLPPFAKDLNKEGNRFPPYLFRSGIIDNVQYLLAYETSVRYTPADIGLGLYLKDKDFSELPKIIQNRISIDNIGNFGDLAIYNNIDGVINEYLYGFAVSAVSPNGLDARMKSNLDYVFSFLDIKNNPEVNFIFVMPPYSALYWFHTRLNDYNANYKKFIHNFIEESEKYSNTKIVCFYDLEEILDLNNYSDLTHFNPAMSDTIVHNIFTNKYVLDSSNVDRRLNKLDSLTNVFTEKNIDWLSKKEKECL